MLTATNQTQVGFEMVSKSDPESRNASVAASSKRIAKDMTWTNVNYNVGSKKILSECWGKVEAGTVCAIMGPSGAGKSSLLNVLAGRSSTSGETNIEGMVSI
jgi:ABC-type transport system involved in cytochrome bd biosynthesis fused ATPase/permease subunit